MAALNTFNFKDYISDVKDFPTKGVSFKDISPLLLNVTARIMMLKTASSVLCPLIPVNPETPMIFSLIESRGFVIGSLLAEHLKIPFNLIRKPGKLPGEVISESYALEYGSATLEVQNTHYPASTSTIIIDDVLATGGTALAAVHLMERLNVNVTAIFSLIELDSLGGRHKLESLGYKVISLIHY